MYCSNVKDKKIMQEDYEEQGSIYAQADGGETIKVHRRSFKAAAALCQGRAVSTPQLPRPLDLLGPLLMRRVRPLSDAGGGRRSS